MARMQDRAPAQRGPRNAGTDDDTTVTVHVPLAFRRRRGRKVLVAPDGCMPQAAPPSPGRLPR